MLEKSLEFLERHGEPVVEVCRSEDAGIEVALAHETEVLGTAAVLGRSDPLEVSGRVVRDDPVDVVALVSFGSCTMEGERHEDMAGFATKMAHNGIQVTALAIMTVFTRSAHSRAINVQYFLPVGIHEIAVRMRPKDFAVGKLRRYFLEAAGEEPRAW